MGEEGAVTSYRPIRVGGQVEVEEDVRGLVGVKGLLRHDDAHAVAGLPRGAARVVVKELRGLLLGLQVLLSRHNPGKVGGRGGRVDGRRLFLYG